MNAETLTALKASIAKWERNAEAKTLAGYKTGPNDCPLCKLYFWRGCISCPVFEKTGAKGCELSPYEDAWTAYDHWERKPKDAERRDSARAAARDEVAFLKSLLPEEKP